MSAPQHACDVGPAARADERALACANRLYPYPLLDALWIESTPDGRRAQGRKLVSGGEAFFGGHFPGEPILPGVLILAALGALARSLPGAPPGAAVRRLARFRFHEPVRPGDVLDLLVRHDLARGPGWFAAEASVAGRRIAHGRILL